MNEVLENRRKVLDFEDWKCELNEQRLKFPLRFKTFEEEIPPQYAIQLLDKLTDGKTIIITSVWQHQMLAAQF